MVPLLERSTHRWLDLAKANPRDRINYFQVITVPLYWGPNYPAYTALLLVTGNKEHGH